MERLCREHNYANIILTLPVGYKTSISLVNKAEKIVTDSGGVQREAFFAKKACVTILDFVVWPETMVGNRNQLARPDAVDVLERLGREQIIDSTYQPFGDGHSAKKIVEALQKFFRGMNK